MSVYCGNETKDTRLNQPSCFVQPAVKMKSSRQSGNAKLVYRKNGRIQEAVALQPHFTVGIHFLGFVSYVRIRETENGELLVFTSMEL